MAAEEGWVGIGEVDAHLQVARDTVYRWVNSKGFPAHRVGRLLRFRLSEVDEWVQNGSGAEPGTDETDDTGTGDGGETTGPDDVVPPAGEDEREVAFSFVADRNALYAAWNALANLADVAGEVSISARAKPKSGFDKSKLENGVLEPLRGLGLIEDEED